MPTTLHTDRNLRLLYTFWFLRDFQLWIPVWIVFLVNEQGFSLTQVTFAEGLFLIGVLALEVPTGVVADRYGRSISLTLGAIVLGFAVLGFAYASNMAMLLVSFMSWSLAVTLMSGADMALLFDTLKAAGRTAEYEHRAGRGAAVDWFGLTLATLLGGPVAQLTDTRATIFLGAATCFASAAVTFAIREVRPPDDGDERAPGVTAGHTNPFASVGVAAREISGQPEVRALVLLVAVTFTALEGMGYLLQPYLLDRGVEVGTLFSVLQVPIYAAGMAGALVSGRVIGRFGAARPILVAPFIALASCLALAFAPGLSAYVALAIMSALNALLQPTATGAINRRVASERRATVLSLHSMLSSLLMAGFAPALGYTTDASGLSAAFLLAAGVALVAIAGFAAPLFRLRHRFDERLEPLIPIVAPVAEEPRAPGSAGLHT